MSSRAKRGVKTNRPPIAKLRQLIRNLLRALVFRFRRTMKGFKSSLELDAIVFAVSMSVRRFEDVLAPCLPELWRWDISYRASVSNRPPLDGFGTHRLNRKFERAAATSPCFSTFNFTGATPGPTRSICRAARKERSMTRPSINGPRSLILTSTSRPLLLFVTRTSVLNGRVRCAAVNPW